MTTDAAQPVLPSHVHATTALDAALSAEAARASAAEAALAVRIAKLEGAVPPPVTPPTSPMPHDLQADINATAAGGTIDLGGTWIATPGLISQTKALTIKNGRVTLPKVTALGPAQSGSWECSGGAAGSVFDTLTVENGRYAVMRLWVGANGITFRNVTVLNGYRMGVITWQIDGFQWLGGRSANHNAAGGGEGYESGGIKMGASTHPTLTGVTFDHIKGQGAWFDAGCSNVHTSGLIAHDCTYSGLMDEISAGPNLHEGFAIWECGWGDNRGAFNGGLLLSSTAGAVGRNGTIAWCPEGVAAISQTAAGRGWAAGTPNPSSKGTSATGNAIAVSSGHTAVQTYAEQGADTSWGPWTPNSTATAAQLTAAGIPTAPQAGH